jgi:type IV pilus assembly protein PilA
MTTFCAACGNAMTVEDQFCRVCGRQSPPNAGSPVAATAIPVGPEKTSTKAILSLVSGLLIFAFPFSIVAVVLGHLSLSEIRKSAGRLTGQGLAIAGLVLGYAGIAFIPIVLILAAIAIPNLLRARIAANESAAAGSIRTINSAQVSYAASHPESGFTCSMSDLTDLADARLVSGQKNGYAFELSGCTSETGSGANTRYHIVARPISPNQTGIRAFCSDESAVVKADSHGSSNRCAENGQPL